MGDVSATTEAASNETRPCACANGGSMPKGAIDEAFGVTGWGGGGGGGGGDGGGGGEGGGKAT